MTTAGVADPPVPPEPRVGGGLALIAATDHKSIGLRLLGMSGVFFLLGGVLALLVRAELAMPGMQVMSYSSRTMPPSASQCAAAPVARSITWIMQRGSRPSRFSLSSTASLSTKLQRTSPIFSP